MVVSRRRDRGKRRGPFEVIGKVVLENIGETPVVVPRKQFKGTMLDLDRLASKEHPRYVRPSTEHWPDGAEFTLVERLSRYARWRRPVVLYKLGGMPHASAN
jgi:hypothetical protein